MPRGSGLMMAPMSCYLRALPHPDPTPCQVGAHPTWMNPIPSHPTRRPAILGLLALTLVVFVPPTLAQESNDAGFFNGKIPEVLSKGTFNINARLRYEGVDQSNFEDDSNALTLRTRFGFTTAPLHGFQAMIEAENILAVAPEHNYNAAGSNNQPTRPPVADPTTTEINQAWISYSNTHWLSSIKAGRQRIALDNHRFVGDVNWRQNQQTFDAVALSASPIKNLNLFYSYAWEVNRVYGDVGGLPTAFEDFDANSHFVNASYTASPLLKLVGYSYLLDFDNSAPNATATYGGYATGTYTFDKESKGTLGYRGEFAWQTDYQNNPADYATEYYLLDVGATYQRFNFNVGYEVLGSDNNTGFKTPLATLHAFNGWADVFLNTPARGLTDLYVSAGVNLPGDVPLKVIYHKFDANSGNDDFGYEFDVVASKAFSKHWSALLKYAYYDGTDAPSAWDKQVFWAQVEFNY